jgi:cytosine/adenosine deaminase-related metal-dependent hydrolase
MRFLRAERIFNGEVFLPSNAILVLDEKGVLLDILLDHAIEDGRVERLKGILTPGFVNTHCHLELSHLLGKIPLNTGLPEFARQVILKRNQSDAMEMSEYRREADKNMWSNGIVAVGDISNGETSFIDKADSKIYYHTFIELIGLNPKDSDTIFDKGLALLEQLKNYNLHGSLAAHASYSTSKNLIKQIADFDFQQKLPFSIHNQESEEETKFMMGVKNGFEELYKFLNLDISWFKAPVCSSLESYAQELSPGPTILVHNRLTDNSDLSAVANKNVYWCFCPNANLYIDNALPNFEIFKNFAHQICLGTDSLASNNALNLIDEANTILKASSVFTLENMLSALTSHAASALNISHNFGTLQRGKNVGLNLIEYTNSEIRFIKKIV